MRYGRAGTEQPGSETDDRPDDTGPSPDPAGRTKTTRAVTVTCRGDEIAGDTVNPATGWEAGGPAGNDRKHAVVFTTDQPLAVEPSQSGGDTLTVTYAC